MPMKVLQMKVTLRNSNVRHLVLAVVAGTTAFAALQVGCSSATRSGAPEPTTSSDPSGGVGSVGLSLTLPGGETLSSIAWTITGPNGASTVVQQGTVPVGSSANIQFLVGNLA